MRQPPALSCPPQQGALAAARAAYDADALPGRQLELQLLQHQRQHGAVPEGHPLQSEDFPVIPTKQNKKRGSGN